MDVVPGRFVGLTVPNERVIVGDPRIIRSGENRPKAGECGILGYFQNFDKCRLESAGDIIFSVALDYVGMNVRAKIGNSRLNIGRIIQPFGQPNPFYALLCSI